MEFLSFHFEISLLLFIRLFLFVCMFVLWSTTISSCYLCLNGFFLLLPNANKFPFYLPLTKYNVCEITSTAKDKNKIKNSLKKTLVNFINRQTILRKKKEEEDRNPNLKYSSGKSSSSSSRKQSRKIRVYKQFVILKRYISIFIPF